MLNALSSSYHQLVSTIVHSTETEDFLPSLIGRSILQENSLRKATWSHGSANLASKIGEPAHAEAYRTSMIRNASTNMKCTKCNKTNHTTERCWFNNKKPQSKPSESVPFQKKQPYAKKQKAKAYALHHKLKGKKKGKSKAHVHFADLQLAHLAQIVELSDGDSTDHEKDSADQQVNNSDVTMDYHDLVESSYLENSDEHQLETITDIAASMPTIRLSDNYEEPIFETWEPSEGFPDDRELIWEHDPTQYGVQILNAEQSFLANNFFSDIQLPQRPASH